MACRFEITLPLGEQTGVGVAKQALEQADRLEAQLTIFRDSSEVSYINRHAASKIVEVTPALFELLSLCQTLHSETAGAFDITSGALSQCWGFLRRQGRIPERGEIEQAKSFVGSDKIFLNRETKTVRFEHSGVSLNLGSIGKGYALDCLKATMQNRVRTALLSAGSSSLCAVGNGDNDRGWVVGIRHPGQMNKRLAVLRLRDVAMATSGGEEQFFEYEGKRYGHIIDPRSGYPAESVASVTVIAPTAAIADALATAFYVGGRQLAEQYCATHPEILVIMLEASAEQPVVFGNNNQCEVEIISE
jgi:thiamine biosynthesis lipoprotein